MSGNEEPVVTVGDGGGGVEVELPLECSSPGWRETPRDVAVLPGRYVFMNCRTRLRHTRVTWVMDGMVDMMTMDRFAERIRLFNGNHSMRLGPLTAEDEEVVIGCRVMSSEFGLLPSPLATITVLCEYSITVQ